MPSAHFVVDCRISTHWCLCEGERKGTEASTHVVIFYLLQSEISVVLQEISQWSSESTLSSYWYENILRGSNLGSILSRSICLRDCFLLDCLTYTLQKVLCNPVQVRGRFYTSNFRNSDEERLHAMTCA
jgi:hypothetical protein